MKLPYSFDLGRDELLSDAPLTNAPEWSSFSMNFAMERNRYVFDGGEFVFQRYHYSPYHIDMIQAYFFDEKPPPLTLIIEERQLILYLMLEGEFLVSTESGEPIVVTRPNTFLMGYGGSGRYALRASPGVHTAMVVVISPQWMQDTFGHLPTIAQFMEHFNGDGQPYHTLHHCRVDSKVQGWLRKICGFSQTNIGAVDGNLRKYISMILEYYNGAMQGPNDDLAYRIKTYLDDHYCDSELSVKFLSVHFFVSERTLLNHFKRQYHTGVQQYVTNLRMARALALMKGEGISPKDIYKEVGYCDENSFRHALSNYLAKKK